MCVCGGGGGGVEEKGGLGGGSTKQPITMLTPHGCGLGIGVEDGKESFLNTFHQRQPATRASMSCDGPAA